MNNRMFRLILVNSFSLIRVPMAVFATYQIANKQWAWSVVVLLIGVATDLVDGRLARKWNVVTKSGHWIDAYSDRLLLISPIAGMTAAGDIPIWLGLGLVIGLFVADAIAEPFELMRVVWWPLCYAVIVYGLWIHSSVPVRTASITGFTLALAAMLIIKKDEVARVKHKLLGVK